MLSRKSPDGFIASAPFIPAHVMRHITLRFSTNYGGSASSTGKTSWYDDIDQALAAYNAVRQPLSQRIVAHARKLGTQLGVGIETDEDRRLSKLLQTPKGIMDWIAV